MCCFLAVICNYGTHFYIIMPSCRTFRTPVCYPGDEALKEAVKQWLEGQTEDFYFGGIISLSAKCRKFIELSKDYIEKQSVVCFITFPFFFMVELQNFLNAPRNCSVCCTCRIFTLYAKALSLDTASRIWDVFFRDGEEFLFRAAIGAF